MRLTIDTMTYGPDGLARTDEGKAVFVSGGLIGDTVEARITHDGPSFSRAVVEEVLEPSADRVQAPCPFNGICGGCPWGGLSHDSQLAAKEENLRSALTRIGKFSPEEVAEHLRPIRHTKEPWGYRHKVELAPVREGGKFRLGRHGRDASQVSKSASSPPRRSPSTCAPFVTPRSPGGIAIKSSSHRCARAVSSVSAGTGAMPARSAKAILARWSAKNMPRPSRP